MNGHQTFSPPPLDGSLTVPQLLDYQNIHSPNHPVFVYDNPDGELTTITFGQYVPSIHKASRLILETIPMLKDSQGMVVGLLGAADSLSYCTVINAVMRVGHVPFSLSPRNTAAAIAHLLQQIKVDCVLVTEGAMRTLLTEALSAVPDNRTPVIGEFPTLDLTEDTSGVQLLPPIKTASLDSPALIVHSSGSTSEFTKVIRFSHRTYLQWAIMPKHDDVDLRGQILSAQSIPVYHAIGASLTCGPIATGLTLSVLNPKINAATLTPDIILQSVVATKTTVLLCVPILLEAWSRFPESFEVLTQMKAVIFAGAPLNKELGDKLVNSGVKLRQIYASIETGCLSTFLPRDSYGSDWEYFFFSKHVSPILQPEPDLPNVYSLTLLGTPSHTLSVINTSVDGRPGYRVPDLLERHPTKLEMFKVYGRVDDQILLSNGSTVNPTFIESRLSRHPKIAFAVMFGDRRPSTGIILQPRPGILSDSSEAAVAEYIDSIWPAVQAENEQSPTHFRVQRQLILVASPSKPFQINGKLQARRPLVLKTYEAEIDAAYKQPTALANGNHDILRSA